MTRDDLRLAFVLIAVEGEPADGLEHLVAMMRAVEQGDDTDPAFLAYVAHRTGRPLAEVEAGWKKGSR